ncbi:MAG: MFS transporter [Deltaproteobacteria bacterium]|nr:MFS transporter [Deltaproteobacteria bacterium]
MGNKPYSDRSSYKWIILALLCGLYFAFGMIARSIAPLVTPIISDIGISFAQMGFILGAWQITYILISLINGPLIDRWGIRKALFAGAIVISASTLLRYFPVGFFSLLFAVALFGVGAPMISIGGPKAIALWFEGKNRGTAIGIFMAGNISGGLAVLSLTNSLVMPAVQHSWRWTFVVYGLITLLIAMVWLIFAREKPVQSPEENISQLQVFTCLIRIRKVQTILLMGLFSFSIFHGLGNWMPKILETGGLSPSLAGFGAAIPLVSAIPAILLVPRLIPGHLRGKAIAGFALCTSILIIVITNASGIPLIAGLALLGMSNSGFLPIMLLILMDSPEIGSKYMGAAGGLFFCVAEVGGVLGPFVMGALVDLTGAFLVGGFFLTFLAITVSFLAWSLKLEKIPSGD